jgi:drug/metabolite transporter (DMT)-like permease
MFHVPDHTTVDAIGIAFTFGCVDIRVEVIDARNELPNAVIIVAAFSAIYLLWGGTYLAIALGLQSIPPFLLVGSRSILGGALLFALSSLRGSATHPWRDWWHAAISGMLLFVGCHGALAYAQRFIPSGLSAIILATIPFWIVLTNAAIGQSEPLRKFVGLLPGFVGVALIAWRETSNPEHPLPVSMIALLLASALAWAVGSVYAQRRASHISPHDLAGMQLICGGAGLLALSAAASGWNSFSPQQVTIGSVAGLLYLALLGSVIGNTAYLWLLDRMSAQIVATYLRQSGCRSDPGTAGPRRTHQPSELSGCGPCDRFCRGPSLSVNHRERSTAILHADAPGSLRCHHPIDLSQEAYGNGAEGRDDHAATAPISDLSICQEKRVLTLEELASDRSLVDRACVNFEPKERFPPHQMLNGSVPRWLYRAGACERRVPRGGRAMPWMESKRRAL